MKNKKILSLAIIGILFTLQICLVSAFTITSVQTYPNEVVPGNTARVNIEIKNNLNDDYENIKVALNLANLPFSPYQSASEVFIDKIREGKTEDVEFQVQASSDASAGIYKIPVEINYNGTKETSFISLTINDKPKLELSSDNYIIKGRDNEIVIKIINLGLVDAKFLSIDVASSTLKLISSGYVYIGDINSNDFDTSSFNVYANKEAPGIISVPVTLTYKDPLNNNYVEVKQVNIKAYSVEEAQNLGLISKSNTGTIIISIIGLIIFYMIYRAIKKRVKNRKSKEM